LQKKSYNHMPFNKIVLLAGKWDTTPVVYNFLSSHYSISKVIIEDAVPRKQFLQKRAKKLGWFTVGGQVLFQLLVAKTLQRSSKKRVAEIIQEYDLSRTPIPTQQILAVSSVNATESLQALQNLQPDLVIVHGTRIISKKILQATNAVFINIHAGITPRYRGSHGAYWALTNNDKENCGVTVHLVDAGIDTGNILAQGTIPFTAQDNFVTYPWLQLAEGLKLLKNSVDKLEKGEMVPVKNELNSALWHHPTLWGYVWKRIRKGVK
jgi:folate-dependent phosphoribosylglycinamide formyltransferase PurN